MDNPIDGILNTSVTWADFEINLRRSLNTKATLGHGKAVLDIGDGNGYSSCCGLVTCDWIGAVEEENLPDVVVIKIPSFIGLRRLNDSLPAGSKIFDHGEQSWKEMEDGLFEIHNTEVALYRFLGTFDGLAIPRMFYGNAIEDGVKGQLCIEHVHNSRMMNFYEKHSVEQIKQIARALGKIQAFSLKKELTAPELQKDFFGNMENTFSLETYRGMFKGILASDSTEITCQLMARIDEILPKYRGSNLATTIHKQMGFRPVIVNGDLHTGNVLIDKDSGDLAALIDWQCAHLGVGVEDLHRIAMSALTTEERRAAMPMLVDEMYTNLLRLLSSLLFPHCALYFVGVFIAMIKEKDPRLTAEEKTTREDVKVKKIIGILEEVLHVDADNKKYNEELKFKLK